ncbi:hypothetical protein F5Y06DRAFT_109082 [Hypoxylon sp. FL0890]|nr:hypothetical protein F5Y06DRAFT_109082 [Hypoxylon sp. FL0890]
MPRMQHVMAIPKRDVCWMTLLSTLPATVAPRSAFWSDRVGAGDDDKARFNTYLTFYLTPFKLGALPQDLLIIDCMDALRIWRS